MTNLAGANLNNGAAVGPQGEGRESLSSFPEYPAYKASGVGWLGEVPEHWSIAPLKFSASCNDTVLPDSTDDNYEIEYVEISDVNEISGIAGGTKYKFSDAPSRARRMLQDGDVLISTVRTYLRAIAPVVIPPANLIASTGFAGYTASQRYFGWDVSGVFAEGRVVDIRSNRPIRWCQLPSNQCI